MSKILQTMQWVLIIGILLVLLGSFFFLCLFIFWSGFTGFGVKPAQAAALEPSATGVQIQVATRTPFQPMREPTLTPTQTWTNTPVPTATPIPTFTPIPTSTPFPTLTPIPTSTSEISESGDIPSQASVPGITGGAQVYNLDCETRSAIDLAAYFGVIIGETEFLDSLPKSDDPEEGFVGNYWDSLGQTPPNSYGVHAAPVARLLRAYGLNAWDKKDFTQDELRREIAAGRPVMVWVIGNTWPGSGGVSYTSATTGNTTTVSPYEHTVLVIGYDQDNVSILDPNGGITYQRTWDRFLDSWSVLGNMAIQVTP